MITKSEIEAKAQEFGLHAANVERDYIFGWLLAGIYRPTSPLRDALVLKGGNAFRKAYFPQTRFSKDLDFSSTSPIQETRLTVELNNVCDFVQEHTGVRFEKERNRVGEKGNSEADQRIYEAQLYFKDFYGEPSTTTIRVQLDVTEFDKVLLPIQNRLLLHPYSDSNQCAATLRCHKLEELVGTKLACLLQRNRSLDLYDLVYGGDINRDFDVSRAEVLEVFLKKMPFAHPAEAKGQLLARVLEPFRAIWHKYLICPLQSIFNFDTAINRFKHYVESLFSLVGWGGIRRGASELYSSNLRERILRALSDSTLLDVTYDGHSRVYEPWSLKFKRRKDGVVQEYLFGYDRTGGRTSGPGPKSFLPPKVQFLANTDRPFDPPEMGQQYYSAAARWNSSVDFPSRGGITHVHIVECSYCRRRFPRKRYSARLRAHKNPGGFDCAGRSGYMAY